MAVKSKVEEISLRPHEFLLPLFEVVVNSIISMGGQNQKPSGFINIDIDRDDKIGLFDTHLLQDKNGNIAPSPISTITVTDNGVGFNDENFVSFSTAYSEKHKDKGCKGVGRFTMLACFDNVQIKSIYNEKGKQWTRNFSFDIEKEIDPKDGAPKLLSTALARETTVS